MSETKLAWQREQRKVRGYDKRYEHTPNGFLMRKYRNMQSRITGVQQVKYHLYRGKSLLDRSTFYEWAKASPDFWRLWQDWVDSGYDRKLSPSVDRIDSTLGYDLDNMEWVTHSENSRRGSVSRHNNN